MSDIIMECMDVCKKYGSKPALNGINMTIKKGRIVGLLGPNGSGKTTLIKLANGLIPLTSGQLLINGKAPGYESKALVSYLPDCCALPKWMKVKALIDFYADFYADFDSSRAESMLQSLNVDTNSIFKNLSKGNQEKVQLVLVMSRRAQLYLLDEPLGGVDPATRDFVLNTIVRNYNPDAAVVISTHLIADVEPILDEVYFINNGEIFLNDMVENVKEKEGKSIDEYFREVFRCI